MLRFGHLKVLCDVANEVGQSWRRINLETSRRLTALCPINEANSEDVAEYLLAKHLCPTSADTNVSNSSHFRYPDILLERVQDDHFIITTSRSDREPAV